MPEPVKVKGFSGLWNSPNPFSRVPEGALAIADDVVIRADGVLESRPGFDASPAGILSLLGGATPARVYPANTNPSLLMAIGGIAPLLGVPIDVNLAAGILTSTQLTGTKMGVAPYSNDARVSLQLTSANTAFYVPEFNGVLAGDYALPGSSSTSAPFPYTRHAGLPRCPAPTIALVTTAPNAQSINSRRTFRVTLAWYDQAGNFYESAPSEPVWVETGGTAQTPRLTLRWPLGTQFLGNTGLSILNPFFRIWRGLETALGVSSNDEMFLTREYVPAAGTYSVGVNNFQDTTVTFTVDDVSIDSLLNVPLYTNPQTGDGFGILSANRRPPVSGACAYFKSRMYYFRTTYQQQLVLQVIGTGTGGIVAGDTITIDGITYTATTTAGLESIQQFNAPTGGGVASNIETAAKSLVECIRQAYASLGGPGFNRQINRQLYAYYASSGVSDFGRIVIERPLPIATVDDAGVVFSAVSTSNGIRFPGGTTSSTDDLSPGGVSWSKPNQPEAVPDVNFELIGNGAKAVLGASVHRDCMIIYKEDGAYICRDDGGAQPTFDLLDVSVVCAAPASIAVVSNLAYLLTTRGILQVSEQGTELMSGPIFDELDKLYRLSSNNLAAAWGFAHEAERLYILGLPASANEPTASLQYVLRVPEATSPLPKWTRWRVPGTTHGCVAPGTGKIIFSYTQSGLTPGFLIERRGNVVSLDYSDSYRSTSQSAPGTTASSIVLSGDLRASIGTGDLLSYNPGGVGSKIYLPRVIAVSYSSGANQTTLTLDASYPFTGGTFTTIPAIRAHWRLLQMTAGEPTMEKQWENVQAYFDYFDGDWLDFKIDSEGTPLSGFSSAWADPRNDNQGGQIKLTFPLEVIAAPSPAAAVSTIQWWRNCRDVILRCDPASSEARAARLGIEMQFAQAQASFRLAAIAAVVGEVNDVGGR